MKRRKVMRLLAVAMAASLAVTSQGIPAGLTTVYADENAGEDGGSGSESNKVTVAPLEKLTENHLYQTVTGTPGSHSGDCYANDAVNATTSQTAYYVKLASQEDYPSGGVEGTDKITLGDPTKTYYKKATGYVIPDSTADVDFVPGENQILLEDKTDNVYKVYSRTDEDTDTTVQKIEAARLSTNKKAGELVSYLNFTTTPLATYTGAYDNQSLGTDVESVESGAHRFNETSASDNITDGYYKVVKYAKASSSKKSEAADYAGAIVITQTDAESGNSDYTTDLGFEASLTKDDVYLPLEVVKVDLTVDTNKAADGTRVIVGSNAEAKEYLATNSDGTVTWDEISVAGDNDQPAAAYTFDSVNKKYTLKVATVADPTDTDEDHMTFTYTKLVAGTNDVVDDPSGTTPISNGTIYQKGDQYYIDVTDQFVTGIAITNENVQYITSETQEGDLDDRVTLTFGWDSSNTKPLGSGVVTSDLEGKSGDGTDGYTVKLSGITDTNMYAEVDATSVGQVVSTSNVKLLSAITKENFESTITGLDISKATYTVKTVTAPTLGETPSAASTATGEKCAVSTHSHDEKDVYDLTTADSVVSVSAPSINTDGASEGTWTYKWVDEVTVGADPATNADTPAAAATLGAYETKTPGLHKVYVEAYFGTSTTPVATTKASAVEFYVVKKGTPSISAVDKTFYDGTELTAADFTVTDQGDYATPTTFSYKVGSDGAATNGFPKDQGTYTVTATFEENLAKGLAETTADANVTIVEKETATADVVKADVVAGTTAQQTVDLTGVLSKYSDGGAFTNVTLTSDTPASIASASFTADGTKVTFSPESGAAEGTVTLSGTVTNSKYKVNVKVTVNVLAKGTTLKSELSAKNIKLIYGDTVDWDSQLATSIGEDYTSNKTFYTVTFGNDTTTDAPTAVGTTTVYVAYDDKNNTVGHTQMTLTIDKKEIKIAAKEQTIKQNGSISTDKSYYKIEKGNGVDAVDTLPDGLTLTTQIFDEGGNAVTGTLTVGGTYTYKYDITGSGTANYTLAESTGATLTVEAAPYTPASGTDTDKTPSTTTEPTLTTNEDGDKVIVDADGKVIADELVTIDGKSYVTDENGEVLTSQIAEVGDVKVYVGKNGVVATDKAVTYEGKKYYATENGEIATNRFVETARGNKVYATKTGELKTSTTFTVKGKKYYAKASGAIATTGFVKTAKGNTVYATKSGALQVNKAFKASNGKKYVADKNGKIVKGKKITIGNKVYTTNKKGVIVKVTTKKK